MNDMQLTTPIFLSSLITNVLTVVSFEVCCMLYVVYSATRGCRTAMWGLSFSWSWVLWSPAFILSQQHSVQDQAAFHRGHEQGRAYSHGALACIMTLFCISTSCTANWEQRWVAHNKPIRSVLWDWSSTVDSLPSPYALMQSFTIICRQGKATLSTEPFSYTRQTESASHRNIVVQYKEITKVKWISKRKQRQSKIKWILEREWL